MYEALLMQARNSLWGSADTLHCFSRLERVPHPPRLPRSMGRSERLGFPA